MEPIRIRVEKDQSVNGQAQLATKEPGKVDPRIKAINGALIQGAQRLVNTGIQHYGDITGDHDMNRYIEAITSIGADIATIAVGGPVGVVAVIGKYSAAGLDSVLNQISIRRNFEREKSRVGSFTNRGNR